MPAICAMVVALAMTACVPPKAPPISAAAGKPSNPSSRLDAIEAAQAAIKSRQDAQESTLLSMQEHLALLDSRLDMIEYSLGIGKGSPHALEQHKAAMPQPHAVPPHAVPPHAVPPHPMPAPHPAPKAAPVPEPAAGPDAGNMSPQTAERVAAVPEPVAAPAPEKAPGQASPAPSPQPPAPAMSKAEQAKMQKAFDDAMRLLKSGDYEKATSTLTAFIKKYPAGAKTPAARYWLGEAWFAQMQVPQAIDALKPFESMPVGTPKRAPALFRLGASYQRQGAKDDAARVFGILHRDYPGSIEAENAAKQLKQLGVVASPPAVPQPPVATAAQPPARQRWAVNIVSLSNPSDAQHALAQLHAEGIHAQSMRVRVKGRLWYRLRVTGYASRDAADKARQGFIRKGYSTAWTGPQ